MRNLNRLNSDNQINVFFCVFWPSYPLPWSHDFMSNLLCRVNVPKFGIFIHCAFFKDKNVEHRIEPLTSILHLHHPFSIFHLVDNPDYVVQCWSSSLPLVIKERLINPTRLPTITLETPSHWSINWLLTCKLDTVLTIRA